jgi:lysine 2,3-aminomutase
MDTTGQGNMTRNIPVAATLRHPAELHAHGLVPAAALPGLDKVAARYAVAVTPVVAELIDRQDPDDPIARQYIPDVRELVGSAGENPDPIGDHSHAPVNGIVHRYPDRVLFKLVHVCAVYCRFCFRREMVGPGKETALSADAYAAALDYIRNKSEIWEVIAAPARRDHGRPRRDRSRQDHPPAHPRAGG